MISSSFGNKLKIDIWGGSHEAEIGVSISGIPKNIKIDEENLRSYIQRRSTGMSPLTSQRKEKDIPIFKTGISGGITTGETITITFKNDDARPAAYSQFKDIPRPSHADFTAWIKYGDSISMSGGGPFSARMTLPLTVAGAIAIQILSQMGIKIGAHLAQIGNIKSSATDLANPILPKFEPSEFPTLSCEKEMKELIYDALKKGDSLGGIIETIAIGVPAGLGGPMYDGFESVAAPIFFGIPAVKGLEFGRGFESSSIYGSENNDPFILHKNFAICEDITNSQNFCNAEDRGKNESDKTTETLTEHKNVVSLKETHIDFQFPTKCENTTLQQENSADFQTPLLLKLKNTSSFKYSNIATSTNNAGGILGGITTGMPIIVRAAIKPAPSISIPQETINIATEKMDILKIEGRHDPCPAIRAVPICEAALALTILELILRE